MKAAPARSTGACVVCCYWSSDESRMEPESNRFAEGARRGPGRSSVVSVVPPVDQRSSFHSEPHSGHVLTENTSSGSFFFFSVFSQSAQFSRS